MKLLYSFSSLSLCHELPKAKLVTSDVSPCFRDVIFLLILQLSAGSFEFIHHR